jgi:hypothetical protein
MGAPGGMFRRFGGNRDVLFVGTRHQSNPNELRALNLTNGLLLEAYTGGGSTSTPPQIGPINGSPAIDYASKRVYFASWSSGGTGDTLWCLDVLPSPTDTPPVFAYKWSRNLGGNITGSPVLRGGRVYVGVDSPTYTIYSLDAENGDDDHTFTPSPADGRVKGFLFPDRSTGSDDLIFATDTKVWSISDDGTAMNKNWEWTLPGLNPSIVLYWPQTTFVYVGSGNGELYELDFKDASPVLAPTWKLQVLDRDQGQVGAPSLDIGVAPELLIVGSEAGVLYGVAVPF